MHCQSSLFCVELVLKHKIKLKIKQQENFAMFFSATDRVVGLGLGFQLEALEPTPYHRRKIVECEYGREND